MEGIVNYLLINTDVLALCCLRGGLRRMRFLISALVSEIMGAPLGLLQDFFQEEGLGPYGPCSCLSLAAGVAVPSPHKLENHLSWPLGQMFLSFFKQ